MSPVRAVAIVAALVVTPSAGAHAARSDGGRVALSISPARIAVTGQASRRIELRNIGTHRVVVDVDRRAVGRRPAARTWLNVVPTKAVVAAGGRVVFTVRVRPPRRAEPGDHHVLVRVTTRPPRGSPVGVRMRLAVRFRLRIPGRVVRRVTLHSVRVYRRRDARILLVSLTNRGNVTVPLAGRVTLFLSRRGHLVARLHPRTGPALPPRARAVLPVRYRGRVRGPVTVAVRLRLGSDAGAVIKRFRLRL